jgi:predicted RND superfamily exporter protein
VRVANEFMETTMSNARSFELVVSAGEDDGIKDPVFLAKVDAFQTWMEKQPRMTRAVSILDILKATHKSLHGDRPEAYRLGEDKQTIAQELLLYTMGLPQGMDVNDRITVKNDALRITVLNTILTSREAVASIEGILAEGKRRGLDVEATGKYYLYQQTNDYVVQSFLTSLWSATLLIGVIMMIFLRSIRLGLISMFPNIVPLFAGGALLRLLGQPLDMGTVLVASVCLGISIDDTSHVLANFAYHRRQGLPPNQAMRLVLAHTGPALLSTNGILIASFATFATATFVPNIYFGVLVAFILTMALVADMFFTPALLLRDPRREASAPPQRAVA